MPLVWIIAGLLATYFLFGLLVRSGYRRVFADDLPMDQVEDGYLRPREVIEPDEDALALRVSEAFANESLRRTQFVGRDDPMFHERHWGHTSALLHGALRIEDVDNLPEQFRVGLFAEPATYPVVSRSGVVKDSDLRFAVNRLAVKLEYPEPVPNTYATSGEANELDLLFVAGEFRENGAGHTFFIRDARQLEMATTLKPPSLKTVKTFANWRNAAMLLGMLRVVKAHTAPMRRPPNSDAGWAGKSYFSLGPFALGGGAVKYNLTPRQTHAVPDVDPMKSEVAAVNMAHMDAWFEAGEPAEFTLGIQLATPDCIPESGRDDPPKSVMAAEYCDIQWDEAKSPYIPVGTLTLVADSSINTPEHWASLQFNPWNTLPVMRPLGQLFRIRKHTHTAHSNVRVSHLYGGTPGEMVDRSPFRK